MSIDFFPADILIPINYCICKTTSFYLGTPVSWPWCCVWWIRGMSDLILITFDCHFKIKEKKIR